jgi:ADP-ribose pyrophosphatase
MPEVTGFEIVTDEVVGRAGGFLAIRRLRLRNRHGDGTIGEPFLCDFLIRPYGIDAVVVVIWYRDAAGGIQVLLRDGLRPALTFGRPVEGPPIPDPRRYLFITELVAGVIEVDDRGEAGVRARAAAETLEEAGFEVAPAAVSFLGAGVFPSPGAMPEKFYLTSVEVDPTAQRALDGDGSPMEHGATTRWMALDAAIAACVRGDIEDAKTELGLRRLKDVLTI